MIPALLAVLFPLQSGPLESKAGAPSGPLIVIALVVNDRPAGETMVALAAGDVWIQPEALTRSGLLWSGATDASVAGEWLLSLASLRPAVRFAFDERSVTVRVTAPPEAFPPQAVRLAADGAEAVLRPRNSSLFVNYAATLARGSRPSYAGELGLRLRGALLRSTLSRSAAGAAARGLTTAIMDDEHRLVRWEIGDGFVSSGATGAAIPVAGVTVARNLSIDPSFVRFSPVTMSGVVSAPAMAEVYVNQQLVSRTALGPGPFDLRDVPVSAGAGEARVVIRDQFGRTQEISRTFYRTPNVLRRGLHEFGYGVGARRLDAATDMWSYGAPVASGQHRIGLTDALTIGASAQAARGLAAGGLEIATRTPLGEIDVQGFASRTRFGSGSAGSIAYAYRCPRFGAGLSLRTLSSRYEELGLEPSRPKPRFDGQAYVSMIIANGATVSAQHTRLRDSQNARIDRTSVSANVRLTPRVGLVVSVASELVGARRNREVVASIHVPLGPRTSASAGYQARTGSDAHATFDMQRSLPLGPGVGYRVELQDGPRPSGSAVLNAQGSAGRVEVRHDAIGGSSEDSSVTLAGAVVAIGGGLHVSRPVDDAFALVRVADVPDVRTYMSNQLVGRTDRHGEVLVPSLVSYYGNRIAIDERDVPMTHDVTRKELLVAPGLRGGAVLPFPVRRIRTITGRFVLPAGQEHPAPVNGDAEAAWADGPERAPLGPAGEFFFERSDGGAHDVRVRFLGGEYVCRVVVPADRRAGGPIQDLGAIPCLEDTRGDGGER